MLHNVLPPNHTGISDEARYNLATRIMSNGVEVIVAGDKSTLPGSPNAFRILPSGVYKQNSMQPTTLKDHMLLMIPNDNDNITSSILMYPNQFVTKTCLTTFTYLKTLIVDGVSKVESHEKVISNIATEEKNFFKITPTPTAGIILSQTPNLSVGYFQTTYTYLNTILDGELPLVVTSKHTVTNTITAPDDYLSLLQPSEFATPITDVNTYYSTIDLTKTQDDSSTTKLISTKEVLTRVVITESLPPKSSTSVMTSYIAIDDPLLHGLHELSTSDVVKTYYVTYTYYSTYLENNNSTIIRTNVSTSSDIVTEKLYLYPMKISSHKHIIKTDDNHHQEIELTKVPLQMSKYPSNLHIYATKTYLTSFTYYTTIEKKLSTAVNSHTKVIENVITETIPIDKIPMSLLNKLTSSLRKVDGVTTSVELNDGQKIEITAVNLIRSVNQSATKIPHLSSLQLDDDDDIVDDDDDNSGNWDTEAENSNIDNEDVDEDHDDEVDDDNKNEIDLVESEEDNIFSNDETQQQPIKLTSTKNITKLNGPTNNGPSLMSSFSLSSLNALGPMINAMAGLIQNNLGRRNDTTAPPPVQDPQNRSPIYIPVGNLVGGGNGGGDNQLADLIETSGSQNHPEIINFNTFHHPIAEKWVSEEDQRKKVEIVIGKPTHETPLLNGGIPISPGEVITANSDVIIGRPALIGPRIPLNLQVPDNTPVEMKPPPIPFTTPVVQQPSGHLKRNPLNSVPSSDQIPEIQQSHEIHVEHYTEKRHNHIPIHEHAQNTPTLPTKLKSSDFIQHHPKHHLQQSHQHQKSHHRLQWDQQQQQLSQQQENYHKDHDQQQQLLSVQQQHRHHGEIFYPQMMIPDEVFNHNKDEVVEIQRIPAIYSTDMPPFHVNNYGPSRITSAKQSALLVNLQPSQVANVLIPQGSSTALIIGGGSLEPHTRGQYFDDPIQYPDVNVSPNEKDHRTHERPVDTIQAGSNHKTVGRPDSKSHLIRNEIEMKISPFSNSVNVNVSPHPILVPPSNRINHLHTKVFYRQPSSNHHFQHNHQAQGSQQYQMESTPTTTTLPPLHPVQIRIKKINDGLDEMMDELNNDNQSIQQTSNEGNNYDNLFDKQVDNDENEMLSDDMVDEHKYDDLENEDGEVIQESNTRPLLPGQLPPEIVDVNERIETTPTLNLPSTHSINLVLNDVISPLHTSPVKNQPHINQRPHINHGSKQKLPIRNPISEIPQMRPPPLRPQIIQRLKPTPYNTNGLIHHRPSGGYDKLGEKSQSVSNRPEINLIERPYVIPTTGYQQYNLYANGTPNKNPGSSDLSKENPLNAQLAKYSSEKRPQIPNNLVLIPPNPVSTQQIHHYQQFGYNIKPQTVLNRPSNNSIESNKKAYNQQHTKISQLSQESATTSTSSSFNHISVTENILAPIIHPFGNSLVKQNISQLLPSSISSHSDIHHSPNNEFLQNQLIKQSSKPSTQVNSIENNIGHITEHRPYNTFIPQLPQSYQQQNNPSIQQIPIEKPSQFPNVIMSPPPPPPSFSPTHTASLIETHHQQQHKNTEVLDHNEQPIPQTTKKYPLIEYPDRQSSKHNIFHGTPINYHQSNNPNFERIPQAPSPSQPLASSPIVKYGNSKLNYKQISMPVNVVDNDRPSYSISTQTEDPYDPKIIKFNNFNDLTTSKNIEPLISTTVRPLVANITEHTTLLDAKNVFVEDGMQLNIGEMRPLINLYVNENLKVNTSATEYEKDFSEIFDFKESNNPHQFESVSYDLNSDGTSDTTTESSITMATETSTTLKDSSTTSTEPSKYSRRPETSTSITTITTITSNVTPEAKLRSTTPSPKLWSTTHIIPEPLEEMRPPPPPPSSSSSVLLTAQHNHHRKHHPHHYHHTVAENYNTVLGMSPPPLIRPSDTHHKHSNHHNSVLFNNQINLINDMYEEPITSTENILIPNVAIESINEMEEFETNSTLELSTTLTTTNKPTTLSTMRTPPTRRTRPPVTGITPPFYSSVRTPSATTPKVRVFITPETSFNPPFNFTTPQPLKRPVIINKPIPPSFIRIPSTTRQYPSIVQQPSVIITKPSDTLNDYVSFHSSIGDVSPTSLTPPKINQFSKHFDTKLSSDDVIIFGSETTLQNEYVSSTKQLMVPTENYPSIDSKSETLNINDRITSTISSTSFIVNTKTLTVTSTQTTVVSSHGDIPFTLTLVLTTTQTSTVIDTVTKTHTLIPEVVTKSIIEPTSIIQTITNIYSKYPEYSINESPNYNPTNIYLKDHGSNLNNEDSIESPLDEYVINYTAKTLAALPISKNKTMVKDEVNESIFVVMVDQNQSDINKKHSSVIKHGQSITTTNFTDNHYQQFESSVDNYNGVLNIADNGAEELPNRDEDDLTKDVNHVLLGGVLVASPPRHDLFDNMDRSDCQPDCKASKNELCRRIDGNMRCICRPGFARMFPDRPCKPTYTYKMQLLLKRNGKEALEFDTDLYDQTSLKYKNLAVATQHSLDRLVMQSDLRDIYHDVYVTGFNRSSIGDGVVSKFYIQLSDNADEKRLVEVFRKYLRSNNNSLGGTELYADENHVNDQLKISDFDECTSLLFNDCSENAQCFNLRGTYTCSCKEGYADMSENPFYPGRFCSAEHIGCEKCHYHGTCYTREEDQLLCECFQWYTGTSCHINLKVLLIALVMVGVLLVILLIVCVCITCSKNQDNSNNNLSLVSGIGAMQINKTTSRRQSLDSKLERKAMIDDSNSETSEESNTLPYVTQKMKQQHLPPPPTSTQNRKRNTMSVVPPPPPQIKMLQGNHQQHNINHQVTNLDDSMTRNFISSEHQKDRSLTVMIPRAKYYATPMNTSLVNVESYEHRGVGGGANATASVSSTTEAKLLSYLDVNPSNFDIPKKKSSTNSLNKRQISHHVMPTGALVSAGFEVSATVGLESDVDKNILVHKMSRQMNHQNHQHQRQYIGEHHLHRSEKTKFMIMPDEDPCESELIDTMNDWLNGVPQNDITVSEARSYDETTIQPPTKLVRTIYDKQSSHMMNDEANTMAERDLGSTFLLPHTHLYKPERGSDISGFDSL